MNEPVLSFEFAVAGKPVPQGSHRMVPVGRPCSRCGRSPMRITAVSDAELEDWRRSIGTLVRQAMRGTPPWKGPVWAEVVFVVARPQKVPPERAGKPTVYPDVDKLGRAVLDGANAIAYDDDGQVIDYHLIKRYPADGTESTGAIIRMRAMEPAVESPGLW